MSITSIKGGSKAAAAMLIVLVTMCYKGTSLGSRDGMFAEALTHRGRFIVIDGHGAYVTHHRLPFATR
jgi:hypothetical protein